jgi:hypothetical protein
VSINEEPYAGNPQVRFCEGNSSSHNYLLGEKYMTTRQSNNPKLKLIVREAGPHSLEKEMSTVTFTQIKKSHGVAPVLKVVEAMPKLAPAKDGKTT